MHDLERSVATPPGHPMTLPNALGIYGLCLGGALFVLTSALLWFLVPVHPGLLLLSVIVLHLAIGVFLNRRVLRNIIEWHPFLATLDGVASEKLIMVVFWPIKYPVLFSKIAADKHL